MIITTSGRPGKKALNHLITAKQYFSEAEVVERKKRSVKVLMDQYQTEILVAGDERFELFVTGENQPFFYHPNVASLRIKRLMKGEEDPLIKAAGLLPQDRFLDCTAGMAADTLVASWYCSKDVTAIETNREIAFITAEGLKSFTHKHDSITAAMRKINLIHADAYSFLKSASTDEYDVVYFDPMFTETINSEGIMTLKKLAQYNDENLELAVDEAKRVARKKILLKDHFRSARFEKLGFERIIRPSTKQHYGIMTLEKPV
ncbi:hypothetical protein JMA_19210 [Jeotgalibacillus malaysiensis]|uniref:SAM-dependent methyltransferase n=1 Tax=Jeotgalibacillus malaysiensis TaxID=1508404 RepID=A0A0B5ARQ2_9BACL|nr:class I SAM-dependent methyltransferase [Jeotgalibacillus malaysiensis]AJD91238.1 hypothetical protein JMA_19210 [Jeotgalibacillus malaysiensis]